jgi:hypothetical protein
MDFKKKDILAYALNATLQTQEGCEKVDTENNMVWFHVDCIDQKYEGLSDVKIVRWAEQQAIRSDDSKTELISEMYQQCT